MLSPGGPAPDWRRACRRRGQPFSNSLLKSCRRKAKPGLDHGEAAVEAGFDGGKRCAGDFGNLLKRKLFMEAQHEHFAVKRIELKEGGGDLFAVFKV